MIYPYESRRGMRTFTLMLALLFIAGPLATTNVAAYTPDFGNVPAGCDTGYTGGPHFTDGCYHMRTDLNYLDTPIIDVLLTPPASATPERDLRIMRQSIEMWEAGIDYLARDMGLDWLADEVEFNIFIDDDELQTDPLWDPEIVVVVSNPVGGAGIGIDPIGLRGPCKGANPMAPFESWGSLAGFDNHHGSSGTYVEQCKGGGTTCYAVNGAIDPGFFNFFNLFDLVSHEVGHCLSVGHVGDAMDHTSNAVARPDIMSYTAQSYRKCVSSLDVEGFAIRMSEILFPNAPLVANHANGPGGKFQIQHPSDHYYASSTGRPEDCPQPDESLFGSGEAVDFYPGGSPPPSDNTAPLAAFSSSKSGLTISVDGSGSSDADGDSLSYSWDFGDGNGASGATAGHTYAASGTYTVTLTVNDGNGGSDVEAKSISVSGGGSSCSGGESVTELTSGVGVTADSNSGQWTHHKICVPAGASSLSVIMDGDACGTFSCPYDADLYVRGGALPTTGSYDCRPYNSGSDETCNINNPASGWWYVSVRGYSGNGQVDLVATAS